MVSQPPRLLLVDDDDTVASVLARAFELAGWSVRRARDGAEAVVLARGGEPLAAAIVDVVLPKTGGLEVVRAVRERHPSCRILVVTGMHTSAMETLAREAGADHFFAKPVELADLVRAAGPPGTG